MGAGLAELTTGFEFVVGVSSNFFMRMMKLRLAHLSVYVLAWWKVVTKMSASLEH